MTKLLTGAASDNGGHYRQKYTEHRTLFDRLLMLMGNCHRHVLETIKSNTQGFHQSVFRTCFHRINGCSKPIRVSVQTNVVVFSIRINLKF